jgi:hypothetical protein
MTRAAVGVALADRASGRGVLVALGLVSAAVAVHHGKFALLAAFQLVTVVLMAWAVKAWLSRRRIAT